MGHLLAGTAGAHDLFRAACADAPSEGEWARGIQEVAAAVLVGTLGIGVQVAEHDAAMRFHDARNYGHTGVVTGEAVLARANMLPPSLLRHIYYPATAAISLSQHLRRVGVSPRPLLDDFGVKEIVGVPARAAPRKIVVLFWETEQERAISGYEQHRFRLLALHLGAGARSREAGALHGAVSPTGDVVDGSEESSGRTRRALWAALCAGRVTLVPRSHGAARHFLIVDVPPLLRAGRGLTAPEERAIEALARGIPAKKQALELGIASGTASRHLAVAAHKLGLTTPQEAIRLVAGLLRQAPCVATEGLTASELEVLRLVREGLSNRDIAAQRGRSDRTIANQIASLLRKTGQASRRALIAAELVAGAP